MDMTSQGWGLYESGRRPGLFRPDVQRRLTGALDSTPEALAPLLSGAPEIASTEGQALADGFSRIGDRAVRQALTRLVEVLARAA